MKNKPTTREYLVSDNANEFLTLTPPENEEVSISLVTVTRTPEGIEIDGRPGIFQETPEGFLVQL